MNRKREGLKRNIDLKSRCASGKRRFKSLEAAERALANDVEWRAQGNVQRREQRVYQCLSGDFACSGWHLTSRPTEWAPRQPLKPRSAKTETLYRTQRRPLVAEMLDGRPCERCAARVATEVHEKKKRSRGGSITDGANLAALCHDCHLFTEEHPAQATAEGWLTPSWEAS